MRSLSLFTLLLAACGGGGGGGSGAASSKNCSDFSCQQDAQAWHNSHPSDGLDADHDGLACESLPNCVRLEVGVYIGSVDGTEARFDVLLRRQTSEVDVPSVDGLVSWGTSRQAGGKITQAAIVNGIALLHVVPNRGTAPFGVSLDLATGAGMYFGASDDALAGAAAFRSTPAPALLP